MTGEPGVLYRSKAEPDVFASSSSCCVGVEPDREQKAFYMLLPAVMEGLLSLACRLMTQVAEVPLSVRLSP